MAAADVVAQVGGGGERRGRVDGAETDPVVVSPWRRALGAGGDRLVYESR